MNDLIQRPYNCELTNLEYFFWVWLFFIALVIVAHFYFKREPKDDHKSKHQYRMDNLKFYFKVWLAALILMIGRYFYPKKYLTVISDNLAKCHSRAPSVYNEETLGALAFLLFLILPMIFEYKSIKSGKQNAGHKEISALITAIILIPFFAAVILFCYYSSTGDLSSLRDLIIR